MQPWQIVILVYLVVVLVLGVTAALAERFGWIKSQRLRRLMRKIYGLDRGSEQDGGPDQRD
jgi:hypothetical protein